MILHNLYPQSNNDTPEIDELYERIKEFACVNRGATAVELLATFQIPRHEADYYIKRLRSEKII